MSYHCPICGTIVRIHRPSARKRVAVCALVLCGYLYEYTVSHEGDQVRPEDFTWYWPTARWLKRLKLLDPSCNVQLRRIAELVRTWRPIDTRKLNRLSPFTHPSEFPEVLAKCFDKAQGV